MPSYDYWNRPNNLAFHDLTSTLRPPPNLRSLLGLGLKFIPTPYRTNSITTLLKRDNGLAYLDRTLRLRCFFCAQGNHEPRDCYSKLRVPSDWNPPDIFFPTILTHRLFQFQVKLRKLFRRTRSLPNIAKHHRNALQYLRLQNKFIIAQCDKNLGPAIIEREEYIKLAIRDHLNDATTYLRLSPDESTRAIHLSQILLHKWLETHKTELDDTEHRYLTYHLSRVQDPLPYLYLLMKVHKQPLKTRPIVSFSGSMFHALGVWIDHHLQNVVKTFPTYLKSSFHLKIDMDSLTLPPHCRLFTADATSMYTNIDTTAAISCIHDYILRNQSKFPLLPLTPLTEALRLLMTRNIFQFGDTVWKQLQGTAMGAPPAPTYANIAFATYELTFIPNIKNLRYYKRYIDDIFGIWECHPDPVTDAQLWKDFTTLLNNWYDLKWIVNERNNQVTFLDMTITLLEEKITCTIYDKPLNLHLFLPPRSAHPPGVLHGLIAGMIYRAKALCTFTIDAKVFVNKFWHHLRARGYDAEMLLPLFLKAWAKPIIPPQEKLSPPDLWLFKITYHPQDPASFFIKKAWNETIATPKLSKPLADIDLHYNKLGHRQFLVCYRRSPNLSNLLSYRKLQPNSGPPVSSYF